MLRTLPDSSVDQIVTSPPYWGLRDYGTPAVLFDGDPDCEHEWLCALPGSNRDGTGTENKNKAEQSYGRGCARGNFCSKCGAWRGQLGLEPTFDLFLQHMVEIFSECKRVLKKHGNLMMNMGDSYSGGGGQYGDAKSTLQGRKQTGVQGAERFNKKGLAAKNLIGQPWRLAFALQDDGWILRQDIIWSKPNPMPESVTDRCTKSHEYIFLLTKVKKYYWNADAIKEKVNGNAHARGDGVNPKAKYKTPDGWDTSHGSHGTIHRNGREKGESVAEKLLKDLPDGQANIRSRRDADRGKTDLGGPNSGLRISRTPNEPNPQSEDRRSNNERSGQRTKENLNKNWDEKEKLAATPRSKQNESFSGAVNELVDFRNMRSVWVIPTEAYPEAHFATFPRELPRRCILAGCREGGIVLDIFAGSGTTMEVALSLGREAIGIDLNPANRPLIEKRISTVNPPLPFGDK